MTIINKTSINIKFILRLVLGIVLSLDTWAIITQHETIRFISKPLLIPLIVMIYIFETKFEAKRKLNFWFILALFFSFLGDVILLFESFFVFGLSSFLMTHLLYIKIISEMMKESFLAQKIKWSVPFLVCFGLITFLIYNQLNDLLIPVLIYGLVISIFGTTSLVHYLEERSHKNFTLFIGAILFIISDSCIAIHQFYHPHLILEILIIILYVAAQYLIATAMIRKTQNL